MICLGLEGCAQPIGKNCDELKTKVTLQCIRFFRWQTSSIVFYLKYTLPIDRSKENINDALSSIVKGIFKGIADKLIDNQRQRDDGVHIQVFDFNMFMDRNPFFFDII